MNRIITIFMLVAIGAGGLSSLVPQAHGALNYVPIPYEYNSNNWERDINYPTGSPVVLGGDPLYHPQQSR